MKEIVNIHIGQCGVQLGNAIWELLAYEHGLDTEGKSMSNETRDIQEEIECYFYQVKDKFVPRAILFDLEPTVIDEVRTGQYRQFYNPMSLINGKEDAANNFARANLGVGRAKMGEFIKEINKTVERADSMAAFDIIHSYAGGSGSGLTSLVAEYLADNYGKKFRYTTSIFPSTAYSQSTVDPYNCVLFTKASMETIDCNVLLDNKALFDQCVRNLAIDNPSLTLINRLVASLMSSFFLSHRFTYQGSQSADSAELLTNLIPYPRIHFPMVFYSPFCSKQILDHEQISMRQITKAVFSQSSATLDCPIGENAFISCAMLYRGVNSPKPVYDALEHVKGPLSRMSNNFVEWCPSSFKIGLNTLPPVAIPTDLIGQSAVSVCMIAGNVAVADAFTTNTERFDVMFRKRAFVHWYVGEGMEETEFVESREELKTLEEDYRCLVETGASEVEDTEVKANNNANVMLPSRRSRFVDKQLIKTTNNNNRSFYFGTGDNSISVSQPSVPLPRRSTKAREPGLKQTYDSKLWMPNTPQPTISQTLPSNYYQEKANMQGRNFNKPQYSYMESVASMPNVVYDSDSETLFGHEVNDSFEIQSGYESHTSNPSSRCHSIVTTPDDYNVDDEEFLQLITQSSSMVKPPHSRSERRLPANNNINQEANNTPFQFKTPQKPRQYHCVAVDQIV